MFNVFLLDMLRISLQIEWQTQMSLFKLVRNSHIACLSPWGATYISVGQLHLVPIDFKLKSNIV